MKPPKRIAAAAPPQQHWGFTEGGKLFRSETPVTNACTNWVRLMIRQIREQYLTPADVVGRLRGQPEYIQKLLSPDVIANWSGIEKFWQWPVAYTSNSVARCLKQFGLQEPVWERDEHEWTRMCDRAEELSGAESRFDGVVRVDTHELIGRLADRFAMPE